MIKVGNDDVLCTEFKVACEICYCNMSGDCVTRTDVVERLKGVLSEDVVVTSLRTLFKWGIVEIDFVHGEFLLYICRDACKIVSDLCKRYWMPVIIERSDKNV